jgi:hypothetical protein
MGARKTRIISASIALFIGAFCCASIQGKVQAPKLKDLIKNSDFIAEGKVTKVSVVRGVRIARLDVARVHKGSPTIKRLYLWASPTWVCDVSDAELDESGLYFLSLVTEKQFTSANAEFGHELDGVLQGDRLYRISWSGYGRLINKSDGMLQASDYVRFPRTVAVKYVSTGDYSSVALVDARDIVWLIHTSRPRRGV